MDNEEKVALILRNVPKTLHHALKVRAATEGRTMQGIILKLIKQYLEEGES